MLTSSHCSATATAPARRRSGDGDERATTQTRDREPPRRTRAPRPGLLAPRTRSESPHSARIYIASVQSKVRTGGKYSAAPATRRARSSARGPTQCESDVLRKDLPRNTIRVWPRSVHTVTVGFCRERNLQQPAGVTVYTTTQEAARTTVRTPHRTQRPTKYEERAMTRTENHRSWLSDRRGRLAGKGGSA